MTEVLYIVEATSKYYYAIRLSVQELDKIQELDKKINEAQKGKDISILESFRREKEKFTFNRKKYLLPLSIREYKTGETIKKELVPNSIAILLERNSELF